MSEQDQTINPFQPPSMASLVERPVPELPRALCMSFSGKPNERELTEALALIRGPAEVRQFATATIVVLTVISASQIQGTLPWYFVVSIPLLYGGVWLVVELVASWYFGSRVGQTLGSRGPALWTLTQGGCECADDLGRRQYAWSRIRSYRASSRVLVLFYDEGSTVEFYGRHFHAVELWLEFVAWARAVYSKKAAS